MKNKFVYIFILLCTVILSSCQKSFLNLTPPTSLTSSSYYQNLGELQQALNGAYQPLRNVVETGFYQDEMRSDNSFFTIYMANRGFPTFENYSEFLDDATSSEMVNAPVDRFSNNYSAISMINTLLGEIDGVSGITTGAKDSIMGQALFLRAFYYYDLVTHYGGVPLQLTEITGTAGAFLPRNTAAEVYTQIMKDLTTAIPLLPVATIFPQQGSASQGAARMLMAYAEMTGPSKNYADAETQLTAITQMNYTLLPAYASVFDPNNKNNQESIFEVQYLSDLTSGQQSDFAWVFMPKALNPQAIMGYNGGSMNLLSGWNVPTQEMVSSYEPGDQRLDASVAVVEGTISGVEDFTITGLKSSVGYTPTPGVTYFYMIKKYFHPPYIAGFNGPDDFPIFRYSGALLLLAECLVNENKAGQALPYLNQVRARAGLAPQTAATLDNISTEARHELAFENHRWTDLIRNGQAIAVCSAKGLNLKGIYGWLLPASFNVTQNRLIYPIPIREIQINTNLTQNPGY